MKVSEKIAYIQDNHFGEWLLMRAEVNEEVSAKYSMFCICRRLCTGLHEMSCSRFIKEVNKETMKKLEHLLPKKVKLNQLMPDVFPDK